METWDLEKGDVSVILPNCCFLSQFSFFLKKTNPGNVTSPVKTNSRHFFMNTTLCSFSKTKQFLNNSIQMPVYSVKAHSEIINCIDGVGGLGIGLGAPEIVTGSRDGM